MQREGDWRASRRIEKIDFPSLDHLMEELAEQHLTVVRVDAFDELAQSELSFVYYVTRTMFVTACNDAGDIVYEYREPLVTVANTEPKVTDARSIAQCHQRLCEVESFLSAAGLHVSHGRVSVVE